MIEPAVQQTDWRAPRKIVRVVDVPLLTIASMQEAWNASRRGVGCDCIMMGWPALECLTMLLAGSGWDRLQGQLWNGRVPKVWYRARPVVVVEDHPDGCIDFVRLAAPEVGCVRLQYGE